jgi:2-hydroxychromene-2-carboxylate isomerase
MAMSEAKRRYQVTDMTAWAKWWGVPFCFPETFPLRTVSALRVALQEPATVPGLYSAAWARGLDIGDTEVLVEVLDDEGFDGHALLRGTRDPKVKQALIDNTARAQRIGACGAPTIVVNDQWLFWGQDRLGMVHQVLSGWRPTV